MDPYQEADLLDVVDEEEFKKSEEEMLEIIDKENQKVRLIFLRSRKVIKTEEELEKAAADLPEWSEGHDESDSDREERVEYKEVRMRGELFSQHPEDRVNPTFNKQVSEESLALLQQKLSGKKLVEAVLLLPENDFNMEVTINYMNTPKSLRIDPRLKCGFLGCLRLQERMNARVLHGLYPNVPIEMFEHKKMNEAVCYNVNKYRRSPTAPKFNDAINVINFIGNFREVKMPRL